ncbi:MAG: hypothetical protein E6G08_16955 [Actinobacteria bacterium]|nr:MAG: hypothetical protein E6G08_16955 [Actinomycetota bacterium]
MRKGPGRRHDEALAVPAAPPFLEREAFLEPLREALGEASRGHGQLVFVAGEAGVGKTALVRALAAEAAGARVLEGRCSHRGRSDRSPTSRPRPGARCRRSSSATRFRTTSSPSCSTRCGRGRLCSCSRTCTGPTRRRSTSSVSSGGGCTRRAASSSRRIATRSSARIIRSEASSADSPARRASAVCSCHRSRPTRFARSPRRTASTGRSSIDAPAATRSSSARRSPPERRPCRRRCAMRCSRARPGSTPTRATCSRPWRSSPGTPTSPCSRRSQARRLPDSTRVSRPGCSSRVQTALGSATSSPGSPSRSPSDRSGSAICTPPRCARCATGAPTSRGLRIMRKRRATRSRCFGTPSLLQPAPRRTARTARPLRSTPAPCAPAKVWRRRSVRSSSTVVPTSAT